MKVIKKIAGIIIALLLVIGAVTQLKSSYNKINKSKADTKISSVVNVHVTSVTEKETSYSLNLMGTLYPKKEVNISAQAQGQITFLDAELGDYKTKGSTIAFIDNELKQLAVKNAEISESKLRRDLQRYENLYKGGSVTEQQFDEARIACETAAIQLDQARKQLADATVTVPFDGVVTQRYVEQGAFINTGSPIIGLADLSVLKIRINASEADIYQLKKGDGAIITTDIYPGQEFPGQVTYVSSVGDASHNYPVELEIPNIGRQPLKAGTFVNVRIDIAGSSTALFIPREALVGSTQDASVYVAENGKAVLKKIILKSGSGEDLQVQSGLAKGETIIVTGQINLVDGKEINIVQN